MCWVYDVHHKRGLIPLGKLPVVTSPASGPRISGGEIIQAVPHDRNDPYYSPSARDIDCIPPCIAEERKKADRRCHCLCMFLCRTSDHMRIFVLGSAMSRWGQNRRGCWKRRAGKVLARAASVTVAHVLLCKPELYAEFIDVSPSDVITEAGSCCSASGGSSPYRHLYSRLRVKPSSRDSLTIFSHAFIRATARRRNF